MTVSGTGAALLIDADNFHEPEHLLAAHDQFAQIVGKGFICHVHGDNNLLLNERLKPIWIKLGARLFPCLPLRKNTTDVALAVDALTLHFQSAITRFGIASGDADFAPLSLELRERGCEVTCFARMAIAFDAIVPYYYRVVRFDIVPEPDAQASAHTRVPSPKVRPSTGHVGTAIAEQAKMLVTKEAPTSTITQDVPVQAVPKPPITKAETTAAKRIVDALPGWRPHTLRHLNKIGGQLRQAGIANGSAPLHRMFRKYPNYFTILPLSGQAQTVRLEREP